jgi:hypothetical protein
MLGTVPNLSGKTNLYVILAICLPVCFAFVMVDRELKPAKSSCTKAIESDLEREAKIIN